jgi:cbb3-type cytochrome oxidase maturation protein
MHVLLIMLLTSFFIALVFLIIFIFSVCRGAFDDLESPSARLFSKPSSPNKKT